MHENFFRAIERGDLAKIKDIIDDSIMSHYDRVSNDIGANAVVVASQRGHLELVKYFVERGVPIDIPDDDGISALQWACYEGYTDIVKYLIKNGADVNTQDKDGLTPLMDAAQKNHIEIVRFLLDNGVKTKMKDKKYKTALDYAYCNGQHYNDSVEILRQIENIDNKEAWKNTRFSLFLTDDIYINNAKLQILDEWIHNASKKINNFTEIEDKFYNECLHYQRALLIISNFYELGLNPAEADDNYANKDKAVEHIQELQKAYSDSLIELGANPDLSFNEQMKEINERYNKKYNMSLYNDFHLKAEALLRASMCETMGFTKNGVDKFDFEKFDELIESLNLNSDYFWEKYPTIEKKDKNVAKNENDDEECDDECNDNDELFFDRERDWEEETWRVLKEDYGIEQKNLPQNLFEIVSKKINDYLNQPSNGADFEYSDDEWQEFKDDFYCNFCPEIANFINNKNTQTRKMR